MGFSCASFVQSMEDFGCIGLWVELIGATVLKCAHALCILLLGDGKIRDGYTMVTSQTGIQFHHHILFHQSLPEWITNSESFVIPMKESCSATCLKSEIYLTLMNFYLTLKKIKQEKSGSGMCCFRLLPEKTLILEEGDLRCMDVSQAVIFGMVYLRA